ncbi:MAG: ATP-binding cassette domain-containing protein [Bacteroidales bacterium]|nr:ATP-binding cassette domain-containing protein [Bacteroidales bacterium]MDY6394161.1 ATP-binding cassette domain-containing protein [Bacteroidales bacterium]MDY6395980.1 ATP-binding cassette domain-containing protein [Bacteroidales bacterium]MDY6402408.1 ATP-binding cassette domain-containing protein [Bacteroidales bacterium]MDY6423762.1 ATP-binding cassette domain-containing protein [Bacteroidales bacterium]
MKNVSLSYDKTVLTDINLTIKKGEFVYLIGKTGAGKSTLLRAMYADIPIESGEGEICGFNLRNISKRNIPLLRRKLGIVFQDMQLLNDRTVFNNLAFVLKATGNKDKNFIKTRVMQCLEEVGLQDKADVYPYNLSEGEMQRIVLARATVNAPEMIIADEPTGNLDPITSEEIVKLLLKLNKENNTTILMATHDYLIINDFRSRVISCENGKIIE